MEQEKHFYRPDEFAERFRLSKRTVYRMIKRGELKAIWIGGNCRIPKAEYERFLVFNRSDSYVT